MTNSDLQVAADCLEDHGCSEVAEMLRGMDDSTPVTEEWLRSIGWQDWEKRDGSFSLWMPANNELSWKCRLAWVSNGLYIVRMTTDHNEWYEIPSESVELLDTRNTKRPITRGRFLDLLRVLGIAHEPRHEASPATAMGTEGK